jgi:hypothetical protein
MNRRSFIKSGALFVPALFLPKLIRGQTVLTADGLAAFGTNAPAGGPPPCTPSYSNNGGGTTAASVDRRSLITVSSNITSTNGANTVQAWVDGSVVNNKIFFNNATLNGTQFVTFDFLSGNSVLITEASFYQQSSQAQGTWKWRGGPDGSSWTDVSGTFSLGGSSTTFGPGTAQTITALSGNTSSYRFYQMLGVSGSCSDNPWVYQMTFKICGIGP